MPAESAARVVGTAEPAVAAALRRVLAPQRVLARPIDRLGRSADASIYRLIPQAIVRPVDLHELRALFAFARAQGRSLTFRAAGTSLSGQAVSDDILVELGPAWRGLRVLDAGRRVWAQPGVVGGHVNRLLAPLGRRLGPDPASIDAAMLGGIVANNASGMCCGVVENSYRTLESAQLLLADGFALDTGAPEADARLAQSRPELHRQLQALRDEVRDDPGLAARIRAKFARKNTTGYSLNALLDFERPADILARLMVGSQGTLGFLADMTLRTVPEPPARATALLFFGELEDAGAAVAPLAATGAAALEIMDAASLRSQASERRYPFPIRDRMAALLVEFRESDDDALRAALGRARRALAGLRLLGPAEFTSDPAVRETHWRLRKGLFPAVGALRATGTAVVTEDVAVPVERLAEAIADLQRLFVRHGFPDTIVFGHAKDGNLHFVLAADFARSEVVDRYAAFMQGLVELIVGKYDGALKAEHGSGRNMAPFVRTEWGEPAYDVMRRLKRLLDPDGILNRGVVLNDDPRIHLKNLKPLPTIAPLADRCIECGFCEPRCPSRDVTLTPRQRIVVTRELARLERDTTPGAAALRQALREDFEYAGLATCVGDSMCETACPVSIDTGELVKESKATAHSPRARRLAAWAASHHAFVSGAARLGLTASAVARSLPGGRWLVAAVSGLAHRRLPQLVPHVTRDLELPRAAPALPDPARFGSGARRVVYLPSCLTRVVGPLPGEPLRPAARTLLEVLAAAGFTSVYPDGVAGLCCGMPFSSKGFAEAARLHAQTTAEALWRASREGQDPIVTDASPCAATLADTVAAHLAGSGRALRMLDFPAFWAVEVLPHLEAVPKRAGRAILHPTCTLVRAGGLPDLLAVARAHAEQVVVPASSECCGFAGDRGFLVPEVTRAATVSEAAEVRTGATPDSGCYSTCRTCEIGLTQATGRSYASLVHLVWEALHGA